MIASTEDAWAKLDVRRSTLARLSPEHPAQVGNVLLSARHSPAWIFGFLDLVRSTQVR